MSTARSDFSVVPDKDQLASTARDLRFHAVANPSPRVLKENDLAQFNEQGFLKPLDVFSSGEIAQIRTYFDGLLAEYQSQGKDSYAISSAHLRHGRVWDLLTEPRIVAYVADLLGENVVGWGSHFFCKLPHDGKAVAWHQDASYWPPLSFESGDDLARHRRRGSRKRLRAVYRRQSSQGPFDLSGKFA